MTRRFEFATCFFFPLYASACSFILTAGLPGGFGHIVSSLIAHFVFFRSFIVSLFSGFRQLVLRPRVRFLLRLAFGLFFASRRAFCFRFTPCLLFRGRVRLLRSRFTKVRFCGLLDLYRFTFSTGTGIFRVLRVFTLQHSLSPEPLRGSGAPVCSVFCADRKSSCWVISGYPYQQTAVPCDPRKPVSSAASAFRVTSVMPFLPRYSLLRFVVPNQQNITGSQSAHRLFVGQPFDISQIINAPVGEIFQRTNTTSRQFEKP